MKTVKPINKDAEPKKYVIEAVKSRDPGHAHFGACQGSRDLLFKFWDPSITFERKKLVFSLFDRPRRVLHGGWWMTPKGRGQSHVTYFLIFGIPSITFEGKTLDTSFFLCYIRRGEYYTTDDEWWITPKWAWPGSHNLLFKFWTPLSITFKWLKLETLCFFLC